jgi:hypothetical protein
VPKILVSIEQSLLSRLDRAARRLGLSRSAYLARLVGREVGAATGPGRDPRVRKALADIDRLVRRNPPPAGFDVTAAIRRMRDTR